MGSTTAVSLDTGDAGATWDDLRARTLDHLYQGVVVTDPAEPDNPIIYANKAFVDLTGYAPAEIVGFNCRFLQGGDTDQAVLAKLRAAIASGESFFGELVNYRRDGSPFWNALSVRPLRDKHGVMTHFVATQTDVTELKNLQSQLQQQQKMEVLGSLAGGIAHDFNNILQAAGGYGGLLSARLAGIDPKLAAFADEVVAASERGTGLTRQLLAFSRKQELEVQPVDIDEVACGVAKMLGRLVPAGITVDCDADTRATVLADRSQLEQVVLNLVVNARDAMPDGGTISVRSRASEDEVVVEVTDTGTGIPPAVQERLFEPFFTTKPRDSGTGLGLSTVYGIVTQLGGTISVASTPGEGSSFTVALPRLRP